MTALKTSRYFGQVELRRTSAAAGTGGDRLVTFEITATVQYAGPAAPADAGAPGKGKG